jgi:hypothetical protein
MGILYVDDGPWGTGVHRLLQPSEIDANFFQVAQDIAAKAVQGVGIDHFVVTGNQLYVYLTDHSIIGPYTLPIATITFIGNWVPNSPMLTNQIFTYNGSTYIVLLNHTSAATFDPNDNDGMGHNFYGLLLSNPTMVIPSGGATESVLTKSSGTDYALFWNLPTLRGLTDVLQSPGPVTGDLVYWNGSHFSYIPQADVVGEPPALVNLSDVQSSPAPVTGESPVWNGSQFVFSNVGGASTLETLTDVSITSVSPDDLLAWSDRDSLWENIPRWPVKVGPNLATYTLVGGDQSYYIFVGHGTGQIVTIPPHSSVPFPVPTVIHYIQSSYAAPATVGPGAGVSLGVPPGKSPQTKRAGSMLMLMQGTGTDSWAVFGDLADNLSYSNNILPVAGTQSIDFTASACDVYSSTPTANVTYTVQATIPGQRVAIIVTTSGTTSYTITFGSGFRSQGTLATGTVTAKVFIIEFISDGTNMYEISRTTAM